MYANPIFVPILALMVVIIPIIFYIALNNAAKKNYLDYIHVRSRYGFMYNEYNKACYYWELVKIF